MLSIDTLQKTNYHAKFPSLGKEPLPLSPSLQSLTEFAVRYFKNSLVPTLLPGNFSSLKEIKEVRERVYSSVSQEDKYVCFKKFCKAFKSFNLYEDVNRILSDYLANHGGLVPFSQENAQAIERFADFLAFNLCIH